MRVLLDTSCLVAAVLPQHEHHAATAADLGRRRILGHELVVAAHAVAEAYSVLTRLPPPHRLAPADAFAVLDRNWGKAETIALTAGETWRVLRTHAAAGVGGGRVYDGVVARCARKARAGELLTWNLRHFETDPGVRAVAPRSE
jgi:predicted nucleic acid-binding protein